MSSLLTINIGVAYSISIIIINIIYWYKYIGEIYKWDQEHLKAGNTKDQLNYNKKEY